MKTILATLLVCFTTVVIAQTYKGSHCIVEEVHPNGERTFVDNFDAYFEIRVTESKNMIVFVPEVGQNFALVFRIDETNILKGIKVYKGCVKTTLTYDFEGGNCGCRAWIEGNVFHLLWNGEISSYYIKSSSN